MSGVLMGVSTEVVLAGISAVMEAVRVWIAVRDKNRTAETLAASRKRELESPATRKEALALQALVPVRILSAFADRVEQCFRNYEDVLTSGGYLPNEIDDATEAVQRCVCRELRRLRAVNKSLPPGRLEELWEAYCRREAESG
jgi:hypothetical protein